MGFGKARTWLDLATAVFASMGRALDIEWIEIPENIRNQYEYFHRSENGSNSMGEGLSRPQWPLEAGISDYVTNYLFEAGLLAN